MKKIAVIAFGMFLFILPTKAQTLESQYGLDSANTILNASLYTEYWKQKNYEEALPSWRYVFLNAPAFQLNTYIRGEDIIEFMIQKTKKKEYVDTLMMVFDRRLQYMGKRSREGYVLGKKGMAQVKYSNGDINMLKAGFDIGPAPPPAWSRSRPAESPGPQSRPFRTPGCPGTQKRAPPPPLDTTGTVPWPPPRT